MAKGLPSLYDLVKSGIKPSANSPKTTPPQSKSKRTKASSMPTDWPTKASKAKDNLKAANNPSYKKAKSKVKPAARVTVSLPKRGGGGGGIYDISRPIKNAARNYMKPEKLF